MQDDADETITRIAAALRPLPDVDPAQKARVLVAVAAERERSRTARARSGRVWRVAGAAGVVAAGLVATLMLGDRSATSPTESVRAAKASAASATAAEPLTDAPATSSATASASQLAARDADGVVMQPVQLVFRAPDARRVSVVGDFNGWDPKATTMTRDRASGIWSQTLALRPGRHVYAFVVDDSVWTRDPRSPAAADADFGRPGSVLLVGRP